MDIVKNDGALFDPGKPEPKSLGRQIARRPDAQAADAYARMMEEVLIDIDDLDPQACPPDRRFFLKDKEAWVYEHGNICELVYVRTERE